MTNPKLTEVAMRALDLAGMFEQTLGLQPLKLDGRTYRLHLTTPEGESTGGGVRAVQHITLVPTEPSHPTLVLGQVNQANMTSELRSFPVLSQKFLERYGEAVEVPIRPTAYAKVLGQVETFLVKQRVTITQEMPAVAGPRPEQHSSSRWVGWTAGLVAVAFALGWWFSRGG